MSIEYLAGFFDGEGSISIGDNLNKNGGHQFHVRVQISNTDLETLNRIKEIFGGNIAAFKKAKPEHRQCYRWCIVSQQANTFLKEISPYLIIKKKQALLALEYQIDINLNKSGRDLTQQRLLYRQNGMKAMKQMNGRNLVS